MSAEDASLKRLRWRCRRGTRELDHVLAAYWGRLAEAGPDGRAAFERLLECEDDVLQRWLIHGEEPGDATLHEIVRGVRAAAGLSSTD